MAQQSLDRMLALPGCFYFFEKHWEELLKFSRRSERQLERWAARYGYKDHPQEILMLPRKGMVAAAIAV